MKLTKALKGWLNEHAGVAADADDDAYRKAAADAIVQGTLPQEKLLELTTTEEDQKAAQNESKLDQLLDLVKSQGDRIAELEKAPETPAETEVETPQPTKAPEAPETPEPTKSQFSRMFSQAQAEEDDTPLTVRSIGVKEKFDTTRREKRYPVEDAKGRAHPYANQLVYEGSRSTGMRQINEPSELDRALCGAYFKWALAATGKNVPHNLKMTDLDNELVQYALHEEKWGGVIHGEGDDSPRGIGVQNEKLAPSQIKAILDDATSGGLEIAPIVFDDAIIQTPILNGEFFPHVNVVNITRGRRIEGGTIGNVTLSSGGADGTAIPLFNTASFISAFDTNIYVVNGAIEIGLDFLSDSPIAVGDIVTAQYGQVLLNWLDTQVNLGDGTTEPEGVHNASGTVSVNAENGAGGPWTVGDYEAMLFGIPKQYKAGFPNSRIRYGANETTYQRARSIAVGSADARRVFGMTHEDYQLLSHPYSILGDFTNRQANFTNWARYRMYRRLGLTIKSTMEGKELVRANQMLITARARFGGQLEDGNACVVVADGQS
jgi:HK97 family phage major capsid protein